MFFRTDQNRLRISKNNQILSAAEVAIAAGVDNLDVSNVRHRILAAGLNIKIAAKKLFITAKKSASNSLDAPKIGRLPIRKRLLRAINRSRHF